MWQIKTSDKCQVGRTAVELEFNLVGNMVPQPMCYPPNNELDATNSVLPIHKTLTSYKRLINSMMWTQLSSLSQIPSNVKICKQHHKNPSGNWKVAGNVFVRMHMGSDFSATHFS